jgi:hypothetical protein
MQLPAPSHTLARNASHTLQLPPPVPQVPRTRGSHVVPWQQPFGQVLTSQQPEPPTVQTHWLLALQV